MTSGNKHLLERRRKIAVTIESRSVEVLDRWVVEGRYPSRSRAMQEPVDLLIERDKRNRLRREVAKLNPGEEQRLAEENLGDEPWPEFVISRSL